MAQLPRGGLVRGHDKPIHGSCAIFFPGGIQSSYVFTDILQWSYELVPFPNMHINIVNPFQFRKLVVYWYASAYDIHWYPEVPIGIPCMFGSWDDICEAPILSQLRFEFHSYSRGPTQTPGKPLYIMMRHGCMILRRTNMWPLSLWLLWDRTCIEMIASGKKCKKWRCIPKMTGLKA